MDAGAGTRRGAMDNRLNVANHHGMQKRTALPFRDEILSFKSQ